MQGIAQPFRAYIIFQNSFSAFSAQRVLSSPLLFSFDFELQLVPTPKEYSSDCTLAILLTGGESLCGQMADSLIESVVLLLAQGDIKHDIIRV